VYKLVKELQPYCAVGVNHTIETKPGSRKNVLPDSMTIDNCYTFHYFPSDFRLWDPKIAHQNDAKQYLHNGQSYYLPFEHTVCLSKAWNWFQKRELLPVRDLDELEELFYWCTSNGNTLVINIPPDESGRIREYEANAAIELGKRLGLKKGKPLPKNGTCISMNQVAEATSVSGDDPHYAAGHAIDGGMQTRWAAAVNDTLSTLTVTLDKTKSFNKITIFEYCDSHSGNDGFSNYRKNRIQGYQIEIIQKGKWIPIYVSDEPMGDCKVIRFPYNYYTSSIRLKVTRATAPPSIYEFNIIYEQNKKR
jgi:alpha-L-fucosidase